MSSELVELEEDEARVIAIDGNEPRNMFALAIYNISLRVAWIFKTETVIMPAFLDVISGQGWIRGWLPILNRFGQSVPLILFSENLKRSTVKSRSLFIVTLLMAAPFLMLSVFWAWRNDFLLSIFPFLFLAMYAIMFCATGLSQLIYGTLQGKLIKPYRRGRLMAISGVVGSILAMSAAWLVLSRLMQMDDNQGFVFAFLITGSGFLVAAFMLAFIAEPADREQVSPKVSKLQRFRQVALLFVEDAQFRKISIVGMLFATSLLLFPHYQNIGRTVLGLGHGSLMLWVVIQNGGVGVFSLIAGMVADRYGYRIVIRVLVFLIALIPLMTLWFAFGNPEVGKAWYACVFLMLGLTPVTFKTLINYVLELAEESEHPRYISAFATYLAIPFLFAPLVGYLFDQSPWGVFVTVSGLIFLGCLLTFGIVEPREEHPDLHVPLL